MKWEVGCAMVSTTTSIGLLIYIVYTRPPNKPLGAGPRDVYLKMLCQSLNSLPPEEWEKVRAKLDVFLGVSPPPVLQLTKTVVEVEEKEMMTSNNVVAPFPSLPSSPVEEEKGEDDSVVAGFRKMLKMGIPPQAVRNKMMQEKIDPALLFGNEASVEGIRSPERRSNANHSVTTTIAKTMPSPILLFPVEVVSMDSTNGLFASHY
ncbi:hypothetical protein BASA81_007149 [Batrachochytrium salamandrivorans]|nr:hypothetical protein BASA81_007149 [Batrachochytrium salamandrivorans]